MTENIIQFVRKKDFEKLEELGRGGLGKAVLLRDPEINEHFVCKKYEPVDPALQSEYYESFKNEIRLMYKLFHPNIVRIFNYYLYPDKKVGYILMEHITGMPIDAYLTKYPENFNSVFEQTVEAFSYLEANRILHRDIRQSNILVTNEGKVKVIDLGFGKQIFGSEDFAKSISLNWWCKTPQEFGEKIYDFATEVYFVGMLFRQAAESLSLDPTIERIITMMSQFEKNKRLQNFETTVNKLKTREVQLEDLFNDHEKEIYRDFANWITQRIAKVNGDIRFVMDISLAVKKLSDIYKANMLENFVSDANQIIAAIATMEYSFYSRRFISVETLKAFIDLVKASSEEKATVIFLNLHNRMREIEKEEAGLQDDDMPF
jgi:serine/threonine-protein kinase